MTGPIPCSTPGITELVSTDTTKVFEGIVRSAAISPAPTKPTSSARVKIPKISVSKDSRFNWINEAIIEAHPARSSNARISIWLSDRLKSGKLNVIGVPTANFISETTFTSPSLPSHQGSIRHGCLLFS